MIKSMKAITALLGLCLAVCGTAADSPTAVRSLVEISIKNVANQPGSNEVLRKSAADLDAIDTETVLDLLIEQFRSSGDYRLKGASARLIGHLNPFPIESLLNRASYEKNSYAKTKLLGILDRAGSPEDVRVKKLLLEALYDRREGMAPDGDEEKAYSSVGLRVCDFAYNFLQSHRADSPVEFPLDVVNDEIVKRDKLIAELCVKLGVPLPPPSNSHATSANSGESNVVRAEPSLEASIVQMKEGNSRKSALVWLLVVIVPLVVIAMFVWKRRKVSAKEF